MKQKANPKLASALRRLRKLTSRGKSALESSDFSPSELKLLKATGYVMPVSKGWYIAALPSSHGESAQWYPIYWSFCAQYLKKKYGSAYCLSPDQSINLHVGDRTVPQQLVIHSPKSSNSLTPFPLKSSIYHLKSTLHKEFKCVQIDGLRVLKLASNIVKLGPSSYRENHLNVRAALASVNFSELLEELISQNATVIAGRLVGAFRNMDMEARASQIEETFRAMGYNLRISDPFERVMSIGFQDELQSEVNVRMQLMWTDMADKVRATFPKSPQLFPPDEEILKKLDDLIVHDAYHSLSIERYEVSEALIAAVEDGSWDVMNPEMEKHKNAMAARGYLNAFQVVKSSILEARSSDDPVGVLRSNHSNWYLQLFSVLVNAGLLKPHDLAGYRNRPVFIQGTKYVPINVSQLPYGMSTLWELIRSEPDAGVRSVLGHFFFVWIHPYPDGNGRMARFLMNALLILGGYPWLTIQVEDREEYMSALDAASAGQDIQPFAEFVARRMRSNLKGQNG